MSFSEMNSIRKISYLEIWLAPGFNFDGELRFYLENKILFFG